MWLWLCWRHTARPHDTSRTTSSSKACRACLSDPNVQDGGAFQNMDLHDAHAAARPSCMFGAYRDAYVAAGRSTRALSVYLLRAYILKLYTGTEQHGL